MIYLTPILFLAATAALFCFLRLIISPHLIRTPRNLQGQTIVITGGCNGIGLETAKILYNLNASVILGCRDHITKYNGLCYSFKNEYSKQHDDDVSQARCHVFELDLSSFRSVRQFASSIYASRMSVNVLINNAGIRQNHFELTSDDQIEKHYQVNYLSHFLLVQLLLPLLIESHYSVNVNSYYGIPSRIIHVSSSAHFYGMIDKSVYQYHDNNLSNNHDCSHNHFNASMFHFIQSSRIEGVYGDTKLMQVLFSSYLQRRVFNSITRLFELLDTSFEIWDNRNSRRSNDGIGIQKVINRAKISLSSYQQSTLSNSNNHTCTHNTEISATPLLPPPIRSLSLHPGFVNSNMGHNDTRWLQTMVLLLRPLLSRSIHQGALTTVHAVTATSASTTSSSSTAAASVAVELKGGEYLDNCQVVNDAVSSGAATKISTKKKIELEKKTEEEQDRHVEITEWLWNTSMAFIINKYILF